MIAILISALIMRFDGIDLTLTADEGYWMQRSVRFGAALQRGDLASTFRTGHPGVTVMWLGALGIGPERLSRLGTPDLIPYDRLERATGYQGAILDTRRVVAVVASVLLTMAVALTWKLVGADTAITAGILLLCDPFVTGMTRLLHPDALLGSLMLVSVLAGLVYWLNGMRCRYLVLSAIAAGLALLTKTPAALLGPFFLLVGLAVAWRWPTRYRHAVVAGLLWGAIVAGTYVVLWPAVWMDPLGRLSAVARFTQDTGFEAHPDGNFFLGRVLIDDDPGPAFYPLTIALRLTATTTVGLLALVFVRPRDVRLPALVGLAAFVALFVAAMAVGAKKLDRYMLPVLMVLDVLGGIGLRAVVRRTRGDMRVLAASAVMLGALAGFLVMRPYPLASYNPLLGGAATAQQVQLLGWGEGLDQAVAFLNAQPGAKSLVIASNYVDAVRPRFQGTTLQLSRLPTKDEPRVDFVVLYVNSAQRDQVPNIARRAMAAGPSVFTARIAGREYAWVFRVPKRVPGLPPSHDDDDGDDAFSIE